MRKSLDEQAVRLVLRAIHAFGRCPPPTLRELAEVTGEPITTLRQWLDRLEIRGLLERMRQTNRALRLTPAGRAHIGVVTLADFGPELVVRLYG